MSRANEIADILNSSDEWIPDLCEELCVLAGLGDEYSVSDGETFESVVYSAADVLGVSI